MLTLREIDKNFDNLKAVNQISFKVEQGDVYGFLGPNGAGKTTTIRMIMGIMQPDSGLILLNDNDSVGSILKLIQEKGGANLVEHHPVEIFKEKESIGENKKSVVFEMIFQHKEKTLEDKDVNPIIDEIIDIAQTKFNAKLRV